MGSEPSSSGPPHTRHIFSRRTIPSAKLDALGGQRLRRVRNGFQVILNKEVNQQVTDQRKKRDNQANWLKTIAFNDFTERARDHKLHQPVSEN